MIDEVAVIVIAKSALHSGSVIRRIPPKTMVPQADSQLGLNGGLIDYMERRNITLEQVPHMDDRQWQAFLDERFAAQEWLRWFGMTPTAIYSVVVAKRSAT